MNSNNVSAKPRKRFVQPNSNYGMATGKTIKTHNRHKNSHTLGPMPDVSADQFEKDLASAGSLYKLAGFYNISNTRVHELAHRLFPGRVFKGGPPMKFLVEKVGEPTSEDQQLYRIRRPQEPETAIMVLWDGKKARCQLCYSLRTVNSGSGSCTHARSVRRYILTGRSNRMHGESLETAITALEQVKDFLESWECYDDISVLLNNLLKGLTFLYSQRGK